jgi:hypothetical protein
VGRVCGTTRDKKNEYRILVGKPEGRRPLGSPRYRLKVGIRIDLREGRRGLWTELTSSVQGVVESFCKRGNGPWDPLNIERFLTSCTIGGVSRRAQLKEIIYICLLFLFILLHHLHLYALFSFQSFSFN